MVSSEEIFFEDPLEEEVVFEKVVENTSSINTESNSIVTYSDTSAFVLCDGIEYDFTDVDPDGDCFYHSIFILHTYAPKQLIRMLMTAKSFEVR